MTRAPRAGSGAPPSRSDEASGAGPFASLDEAHEALELQTRTVKRLHFLIQASKILNSTLDLGELLGIILDMTTKQTGAERATLFLVDSEKRELLSLVAQGLEQKEIRMPMSRGLAGWVAESGHIVTLADAHADPRFDPSFDEAFGYRTRTLLVMPVKDRAEKIIGVLELLNKPAPGFTADDVGLLESISVHAAIALENAWLHRQSLERQRLDRELSLARTIQQGLLPEAPPVLEGLDIAVRHQTPLYVGGDYYDFLELTSTTLLFVIADVEGKGMSSALIMSNLQATLHAVVKHVHSLEGIMFHLNEDIRLSTRGEKYLTLFLGLLDLPRKTLHYINAGHLPPIVMGAEGVPALLQEGGMVIGLMPLARYKRGFVQLASGDVVLACTNGITEASSLMDEAYGTGRLVRALSGYRERSAREIVDAIFAEVVAYSEANGRQQDDKVLMAIKVR